MGDWAGDHHTGWAARLHGDSLRSGNPKKNRKKTCEVCGATMNRKNLKKHMARHTAAQGATRSVWREWAEKLHRAHVGETDEYLAGLSDERLMRQVSEIADEGWARLERAQDLARETADMRAAWDVAEAALRRIASGDV